MVQVKSNRRRFSENYRVSSMVESKYWVPSCVFSKDLSSFETIVKYLKENYSLGFQDIASELSKSRQSVWRAYKFAVSKQPESFVVTNLKFPIPISIFKDSKSTLLESLVKFMHDEYKLSFSEISALLMRDERTIWTVFNRAIKHGNK